MRQENSTSTTVEGKIEKRQKKKKKTVNLKWPLTVFALSAAISVVLGIVSSEVISGLKIGYAFAVLMLFISLGIIFDVIGLAVATASDKSFHSMAARRIPAGKKAVKLIKNADKVSSFCNDVIGDICGIISGATGATICITLFMNTSSAVSFWGNLGITAAITGLTVGGKALFKGLAIEYSEQVVLIVAKILCLFKPRETKGKK